MTSFIHSFIHSNKESINQSINHPKGPHDGNGSPMKNIGIPIPQTDEWKQILLDFGELAIRDGTSKAWVIREAMIEYHHRHWPGNPGLPLDHWTGDLPFSEAAREKLQAKTEPKTAPDYSSMSDEHLLERYNSSFTDSFDIQLIALEIQKRGFNLEDLRHDKRLRRPQ